MQLSLRVHYTMASLPIIDTFVQSSAKYFGATKNEIYNLALAAEEASGHIITNFPSEEINAPFDIYCEKEGDVLRFIFSNTGIPVDVEGIPEYNSTDPENSTEGLEFFLIEKFTDNFKFVNLGAHGWQTVIEKKLQFTKAINSPKAEIEPAAKNKEKGGKPLSFTIAGVQDAYQITKLAYYTYRYSYAKKIFYYPELLREALASQQIISFIVKDDTGDIVAHSALLRSKNCNNIAESGALMSRPDYRNSTATFTLLKKVNEFLEGAQNPGIDLLELNLVTAHISSQKVCRFFDVAPLALKLSEHEGADFIKMKDVSSRRESLLYAMIKYKTPECFDLYAPGEHKELIIKLMDYAGFNYKMLSSYILEKQIEKSTFIVERVENAKSAKIIAIDIGRDFFSELKRLLYSLTIEDIMTVALKIPLWTPLPENLDAELQSMSFFFSGVVAATTTRWQILYTHLNHHHLDFEKIKVYQKLAKELKTYVNECYEKVIP